jgi:serine/threonine protein kinase
MEKYHIGKIFRIESFGNIYKATTIADNSPILIKKIPIQAENRHLLKIQNEVETLMKLNHPNIAKYYEFSQDDDYLYIMMEFCQGKTLKEIIKEHENDHFTEDFILEIFSQIIGALKYIHERNILYHSIDSENIILSPNKIFKFTNFKIAIALEVETMTNSSFPKISGYESPEIIQGENPSFASDIWSFGVILYELMMLKQPFADQQLELVGRNICYRTPEFSTNYSPELMSIVQIMLDKNPNCRPTLKKIQKHPILWKIHTNSNQKLAGKIENLEKETEAQKKENEKLEEQIQILIQFRKELTEQFQLQQEYREKILVSK